MTPKRRRDLHLCALALALMAAFAAIDLIALDVPWLRRVELTALDLRMKLRGAEPPGPETVIVLIDDRSIAEFGRWPLPRRRIAELIALLQSAGTKAIGIDILFADPEQVTATAVGKAGESSGDDELAQAIRTAGNVVLPFTFQFGERGKGAANPYVSRAAFSRLHDGRALRPLALEPTGLLAPVPALASVSTLGHVLVAFDVDGAPRYDYPALRYDLDFYPSMAVRVAQVSLGVPWNDVRVELGRGIRIGSLFVPTDPQMRLLVNYLGRAGTFPTYPMADVLAGKVPASTFAHKVALIGTRALGLSDTFQSPFTSVMPGVERLATVVDSILHERHIRRPDTAPWVEIGLMLAAALALGLAMSRLSLVAASSVGVALAASVIASGQIALTRFGLWQTAVVPIVGIVLTFVGLLLFRTMLLSRQRRRLRSIFARYLSPQMVDRLVANEELPVLGGELREITVLFCDLRGFTSLSEVLDPVALARLTNEFFGAATDAILEHGGTVDKYIGDAIMAFWNAPLDQPNHPELACRAALRMQEKLELLFASSASEEKMPRLAFGIGINTGSCTVGNFGSARRFDYTAIGDAVNVAARLEGETKSFGTAILLGPETAARLGAFATLPIDSVHVRGRVEMLEIHALVGDEKPGRSTAFETLRAAHMKLRHALQADDRDAVLSLAAELEQSAPPALKSLYAAYARRAARNEG